MGYLVTGATGFIGGQLAQRLLADRTGPIHCLVRQASVEKLEHGSATGARTSGA